jgi:hypothetical protein
VTPSASKALTITPIPHRNKTNLRPFREAPTTMASSTVLTWFLKVTGLSEKTAFWTTMSRESPSYQGLNDLIPSL